MPHGNQQMGRGSFLIFRLLLLWPRHGNQLCSSQFHEWHHVLEAIIILKKKLNVRPRLKLQINTLFIKTWRFSMLLSILGFKGMKGEGRIHKNYSIVFVSSNMCSHHCHLKYWPLVCSFSNVLSSCLHFLVRHNYTNNHFSTTHSHAHSRVNNAPPGSGRAVGWGRTGTSVSSHSDRRSPNTRGRLGNKTDIDPEMEASHCI